ncbi:uncharacterized protein LOC123561418 [Mercenaria mercenaria]|uniref:uncharacterized protein LOC123561418 n=1 Tax=Mercenaria mercenaria TaxID=6596 RepID=UPI00234EE3E6|nr:uncharacterized protein LOC123561418 [Mercenaria mercenaria]XP_053381165.1 uncharacterized protein LOC123561418 [Mercenaria mercenaria]XP_053381166.1 uncharacterized protein LOC123561418 [Mercenaria mercenaria]XP_053381167.1 uncharacterized protein LOC123561418 [Mercenaria mercenaria]XP_053381168.1 uncharacterized protein LOC123561418 [Mercenaria mercenaria]XP_053381169.1 uncharacterized protein LOC123561418 [Mercenaria mercenaria]
MTERIYSDGFVYWIKCTLALQKTKEGTAQYVENTMKSLIESFDVEEEHIRRFLKKVTEENKQRITFKKGRGNKTWTFKSKCKSKCQNMFRIIMDKHARKSSNKLNWDFHDPSVDYSPDDYWWIIAKIYMPDHNEESIRPDQVDPLSIFSMLLHCELFVDVWDNADKIIQVRNKLMHSATYTVTVDESEMKDAFAKMKELLKRDRIVDTSSKAVAEIEKIEQERFFLSNITEENNEMMLRALEIKHDALEYEIKA